MKKLLLFIATGAVALPGFGQASKSVVFTGKLDAEKGQPTEFVRPVKNNNKTTAGGSSWFDYGALFATVPTGSSNTPMSKGYYWPIYQDSNVVANGSTSNFNIHTYGMGISFDPTDSVFFSESTSIGIVSNPDLFPTIRVTQNNSYTVDSMSFAFKYRRKTNNDDTLYIQYVKGKRTGSNPFGIYSVYYTDNTISPDGTGDLLTTIYDKNTNKISDSVPSASVMTQMIVLNSDWANDTFTTGGGYSKKAAQGLALPTPLSIAAGEVFLAYVSFKSSANYPLGTNENSANTIRMDAYDIQGVNGSPKQTSGSMMSGLAATQQNKYTPPYTAVPLSGHNILLSSLGYNSDGRFTDMSFHINCSTCPTSGISEVKSFIIAQAYPNPAAEEIHIPFVLKSNANVNVSLSNTMGQVVATQNMGNKLNGEATFSTTNLANGVYFYTVEANGQRQTGRVVVNH